MRGRSRKKNKLSAPPPAQTTLYLERDLIERDLSVDRRTGWTVAVYYTFLYASSSPSLAQTRTYYRIITDAYVLLFRSVFRPCVIPLTRPYETYLRTKDNREMFKNHQ